MLRSAGTFRIVSFLSLALCAPSLARADPPTTARVTIRADGPVVLQREDDEGWTTVCGPSCELPLSTKPRYRIDGAWIQTSTPFTLPRGSESVVLQVDRGSTIPVWLGAGLLMGGAVVAASGVYSALWGGTGYRDCAALREPTGCNDGRGGGAATAIAVGLVAAALGLVVTIAGLASKTTVRGGSPTQR
jgi:hypothetical protein